MLSKKVLIIKRSLKESGFYTPSQISEICELEQEYLDECDEIAMDCLVEGHPSWGVNYELRCENLRKHYDRKIELIDAYVGYDKSTYFVEVEEIVDGVKKVTSKIILPMYSDVNYIKCLKKVWKHVESLYEGNGNLVGVYAKMTTIDGYTTCFSYDWINQEEIFWSDYLTRTRD